MVKSSMVGEKVFTSFEESLCQYALEGNPHDIRASLPKKGRIFVFMAEPDYDSATTSTKGGESLSSIYTVKIIQEYMDAHKGEGLMQLKVREDGTIDERYSINSGDFPDWRERLEAIMKDFSK